MMVKASKKAARPLRGTADPIERIEQAILSGQLFPNERLVEQELAIRFNANRGAIRTALAVLEQKDLVVRELHRGARVRAVSESEAIEIMEMRSAVEALTARHAAINATKQDISELRLKVKELNNIASEGNYFAYSLRNMELHDAIAAIARHGTAQRILAGLCSRIVALHYRPILEPGRVQALNTEHIELVECISAHDPDAAERSMRRHLDNAVIALKAAIAHNRAPSQTRHGTT